MYWALQLLDCFYSSSVRWLASSRPATVTQSLEPRIDPAPSKTERKFWPDAKGEEFRSRRVQAPLVHRRCLLTCKLYPYPRCCCWGSTPSLRVLIFLYVCLLSFRARPQFLSLLSELYGHPTHTLFRNSSTSPTQHFHPHSPSPSPNSLTQLPCPIPSSTPLPNPLIQHPYSTTSRIYLHPYSIKQLLTSFRINLPIEVLGE